MVRRSRRAGRCARAALRLYLMRPDTCSVTERRAPASPAAYLFIFAEFSGRREDSFEQFCN